MTNLSKSMLLIVFGFSFLSSGSLVIGMDNNSLRSSIGRKRSNEQKNKYHLLEQLLQSPDNWVNTIYEYVKNNTRENPLEDIILWAYNVSTLANIPMETLNSAYKNAAEQLSTTHNLRDCEYKYSDLKDLQKFPGRSLPSSMRTTGQCFVDTDILYQGKIIDIKSFENSEDAMKQFITLRIQSGDKIWGLKITKRATNNNNLSPHLQYVDLS